MRKFQSINSSGCDRVISSEPQDFSSPAIDVSQEHLIEQIIQFMQYDYDESGLLMSDQEKACYRQGLCLGFSSVYAYMVSTGKSHWWLNVLSLLSTWDGSHIRLNDAFVLAGANDRAPVKLHVLFTRAISYILFYADTRPGLHDPRNNQADLMKVKQRASSPLFDSEQGEIAYHAVAVGNFSAEQLNELIDPSWFESPLMMLFSAQDHSAALHYDKASACWVFYDPNNSLGAIHFYDFKEGMPILHERLGETFEIVMSTYDKRQSAKAKCSLLMSRYAAILRRDCISLLQGYSLELLKEHSMVNYMVPKLLSALRDVNRHSLNIQHVLLKSSGERGLPYLLELMLFDRKVMQEILHIANRNDLVRKCLVQSIGQMSTDGKICGFEMLIRGCHDKDMIAIVSTIAGSYRTAKTEEGRQTLSNILCMSYVKGESMFHRLCRKGRVLGHVFYLAQGDECLRNAIIDRLLFKSADGLSGLSMYLRSPGVELKSLFQLSSDSVEVAHVLMSELRSLEENYKKGELHPFTQTLAIERAIPTLRTQPQLLQVLLNFYDTVRSSGVGCGLDDAACRAMDQLSEIYAAKKEKTLKALLVAIAPELIVLTKGNIKSRPWKYNCARDLVRVAGMSIEEIKQIFTHTKYENSYLDLITTVENLLDESIAINDFSEPQWVMVKDKLAHCLAKRTSYLAHQESREYLALRATLMTRIDEHINPISALHHLSLFRKFAEPMVSKARSFSHACAGAMGGWLDWFLEVLTFL